MSGLGKDGTTQEGRSEEGRKIRVDIMEGRGFGLYI